MHENGFQTAGLYRLRSGGFGSYVAYTPYTERGRESGGGLGENQLIIFISVSDSVM